MLTYQKKGIYLQVAYDIRTARTITSYAKESNSTLQIHRTCYTYIKHTYTCLHTAQTKPNNNNNEKKPIVAINHFEFNLDYYWKV